MSRLRHRVGRDRRRISAAVDSFTNGIQINLTRRDLRPYCPHRRCEDKANSDGHAYYPLSGSVMLRGLSAAFSSVSLTTLSLSFFFSVPALIFSMARSRTVLPDLNASLAMAAAAS